MCQTQWYQTVGIQEEYEMQYEPMTNDDYYREQQNALPKHKREGYAERMYERADDQRKREREEGDQK